MSVIVLKLISNVFMILTIAIFVRRLPKTISYGQRRWRLFILLIFVYLLFLQISQRSQHFIWDYLLGLLLILSILSVMYTRNLKLNLYIALWGMLSYMTGRGIALSVYSLVSGMAVEFLVQETVYAYIVRILGYLIVIFITCTCGVDTMKALPEVAERKLSYRVLMAQMVVQYVLLALAKEMCAVETEYRTAGIFYLSLCIMSSFLYMISLNYAKAGIRQVKRFLENEQFLNARLESQLSNYNVQAKYIEKLRAFKHDYLNQMRGITYLMEADRLDEVRDYVTALNKEMNNTEGGFRRYSNVPLIDAILRDTQSRCEKSGIMFNASLQLKRGLCLTPLEQCIFFSDLLNLAIKGVLTTDWQYRCIWIEKRFRDQWTVIKCTVFCDESFKIESSETERLRNITEARGGFFDVRIEEGVCTLLCSWIEEEHNGTGQKTNI